MASKRVASNELNHDNWDTEDEPEKSGSFSRAGDDILKNRVIKVARRRNPIGTLAGNDEEKKTAFAAFGGFSKTPSTPTSAFDFLSNLNKPANGTNNLKAPTSLNTQFQVPENKSVLEIPKQNDNSKEYYAKLKGLNQSASNWIKKHVDGNPFINLTPVFRDYEKYLSEIEKLKVTQGKTEFTKSEVPQKVVNAIKPLNKTFSSVVNTSTTKTAEESQQKFNFGIPSSTSDVTSSSNVTTSSSMPMFNFAKTTTPLVSTASTTSSSTPALMFSFGKAASPSSTAGFTFGSDTSGSKPFAFANVAKPTTTAKENKNEEEDEPPKVEFTPVVEEGHVYTIRCKVFVKKGDNFGDRGVGNLYLKPVPNSEKSQLIVRADTNLGNLLCNLILSANIPMKRMGKKDVMLVCMPTPDSKPPPVPVLLRVKSPEEADELLKTLEKHKK